MCGNKKKTLYTDKTQRHHFFSLMFRENYASRLSMLKYSRKPYEVQDQRTRQDKDELSRLNMFPQKGKNKHKAEWKTRL